MSRSEQRASERENLLAAMERLLDGTPNVSQGGLTVLALIEEAGYPPKRRYLLTQKHTDIKNEFYRRIEAQGFVTEPQKALTRENLELQTNLRSYKSRLEESESERQTLLRLLNLLSVENDQLRRGTNVRPFRKRTGQSDPST